MSVLAFWIVVWLLSAGLGGFIASAKRREVAEGFMLGLIFGFIGVAVELFLPNGKGR